MTCGVQRRPKTLASSSAELEASMIPLSFNLCRVFVRPSVSKDCWFISIPNSLKTFCCLAVGDDRPRMTIRRAVPASAPRTPTSASTPRAALTSSTLWLSAWPNGAAFFRASPSSMTFVAELAAVLDSTSLACIISSSLMGRAKPRMVRIIRSLASSRLIVFA